MNTFTEVKGKWQELSEDEKFIMGRPNFTCGAIARLLRTQGFEIPTKAEKEQSIVIFMMLEFYKKFGVNWKDNFNEELAKIHNSVTQED